MQIPAFFALMFAFAIAAARADEQPLPQLADTAVNGVALCNPASVKAKLGNAVVWKTDTDANGAPYFHADVRNSDKTETLSLIGHPGDAQVNFEMRVRQSSSQYGDAKAVSTGSFVTARGIRLGMTSEEVTAILGYAKASRRGPNTILRYALDSTASDYAPLLALCNMPVYSARYTFARDRLAEFRFGFDNP